MKRVISMMLLTLACLFSAACAHPQGYIDFTQPEGPRPAVEQTGVKPLRIAFASVMSPRETRQVYQQIVTYISQKQQWPAVLIQRRTYEELNASWPTAMPMSPFPRPGLTLPIRAKCRLSFWLWPKPMARLITKLISSRPPTAISMISANSGGRSLPLRTL